MHTHPTTLAGSHLQLEGAVGRVGSTLLRGRAGWEPMENPTGTQIL